MTLDYCATCGLPYDEFHLGYCCICGDSLCDDCLRTPAPPGDDNDYCLNCYAKEGYADVWVVKWVNPQYGDVNTSIVDAEPGTHPFKIPRSLGIPRSWLRSWHKRRDEDE